MKAKRLVLIIGAALGLILYAVSFAKCSWLEPFIFLHAPWRQECQLVCRDRVCIAYKLWKSQAELDIQENIPRYRARAEKGDLAAQMALGGYYSNPALGAENTEEAIKWWGLAAERGNAEAQYRLGILYSYGGQNGKKTESQKWLRMAAEQGKGESFYWLSRAYADPLENYFWGYLDSCISHITGRTENLIVGAEAVKHCRHGIWYGLSPEQKRDVEKRAEQWLMDHDKIEMPILRAVDTF
ncbi:MAG: sel1 repeat family protein [Alphaproteobacteria bacterium]|nr:MAG: sel1 repeat family protein [Alphaproteobacteria bacterium]